MSLLADTILADAEAIAYPYVSKRAVAPGPLLRTLTTLDAEVTGMVVSTAPELISVDATPLDVVFATNATGYTLTAARAYTDIKYEDKDGIMYPVRIVPMKYLDNAPVHPAVVIENGKLYPCDVQEQRWQDTSEYRKFFVGDGDKIHYRYVAPDARLTTLTGATGTLASPDFAAQYFVWSIAFCIILAFHGVDGIVPSEKLTAVREMVDALRFGLWQSIARAAQAESSARSP